MANSFTQLTSTKLRSKILYNWFGDTKFINKTNDRWSNINKEIYGADGMENSMMDDGSVLKCTLFLQIYL